MALLELLCDLNFKDFYKISILVSQYKPEIYPKKWGQSQILHMKV